MTAPPSTTVLGFLETDLVAALDRLPATCRTAFALLCVERLLPTYQAYERKTRGAEVGVAERLVARLWADLGGEPLAEAELARGIADCDFLLLSEDDDGWDPYSEDAAIALHYAWDSRAGATSQHAAWAARHAYEALDQFVIKLSQADLNEPGVEERLLAHPLIQAELHRQARDLEDLGHSAAAGDNSFTALRDRARRDAAIVFQTAQDFGLWALTLDLARGEPLELRVAAIVQELSQLIPSGRWLVEDLEATGPTGSAISDGFPGEQFEVTAAALLLVASEDGQIFELQATLLDESGPVLVLAVRDGTYVDMEARTPLLGAAVGPHHDRATGPLDWEGWTSGDL